MASQNANRLDATQRVVRNISDLPNALNKKQNCLRQSFIDEEVFDMVSGFETVKKQSSEIK